MRHEEEGSRGALFSLLGWTLENSAKWITRGRSGLCCQTLDLLQMVDVVTGDRFNDRP